MACKRPYFFRTSHLSALPRPQNMLTGHESACNGLFYLEAVEEKAVTCRYFKTVFPSAMELPGIGKQCSLIECSQLGEKTYSNIS